MIKRKQEQTIGATGWGQVVRVTVLLVALLLLSGVVPVQAQKMPYSFTTGEWFHAVNPKDHTPYYLPYYDPDRMMNAYLFPCFYWDHYARRHQRWDWYPWTSRWGRYDVPNDYWWSFGEGFYDEYGTGWLNTAADTRNGIKLAGRLPGDALLAKTVTGKALVTERKAMRKITRSQGMHHRSAPSSSGRSPGRAPGRVKR